MSKIALTVYQGRAGDRNERARPAALAIGEFYSDALGISPAIVGTPRASLNDGWRAELDAAVPELLTLSSHCETMLKLGKRLLAATGRCATSIATLPVVAEARPDAVIVWFDAHGDLNTPETSTSGYLGGMALSGPAGLWDSELGDGLSLANVILVAARDLDPAEKVLVDQGKVTLVSSGWGMMRALGKAIAGRPAYVHLDCDVLKPRTVPTEHSCPGGLSLRDLRNAAKVIAKGEVIGLEIAELQVPETGELTLAPLMKALDPLVTRMLG
jgi:arginase family enzyme